MDAHHQPDQDENKSQKQVNELECVSLQGNTLHDRFISQLNPGHRGYVRIGDCTLTQGFKDKIDTIVHFDDVRDDDVWIVTFPKSGTTWTQEMVWLIMNDMDFSKAGAEPIYSRAPFFEFNCLWDADILLEEERNLKLRSEDSIEMVRRMKSPRCVKSHLPFNLLPRKVTEGKNAKIIYVARNVKDVVVSYYYHHKLIEKYTGSFDEFAEYFRNNLVVYSSFWEHILEFWNRRYEDKILFLKYEDMKRDLRGAVEKVCKFLNKEYRDDQISALVDHLSFDKMQTNTSVNYAREFKDENGDGHFMRKGIVGDWKNHMNEDMQKPYQKWIKENLATTDYVD